jgi:hypothetical protein
VKTRLGVVTAWILPFVAPRWATLATTRIGQLTPSAGIAKLLGAPLAQAQISIDAPRRLGRSYGIDDGASPSYGMGGMRRRDVLTVAGWLASYRPGPVARTM